jgi:uncharacterized protein
MEPPRTFVPPAGDPLSDGELDRLEELLDLLAGRGDAMMLDELHGLLTAVACTPGEIPTATWRPLAGSRFLPGESAEEAELTGLASRLGGEIAATLAEGGPFEPIFAAESEEDDALLDVTGWCLGFVAGMNLRRETWEGELGRGLAGVFLPIVAGTGDETLIGELPEEELSDIENNLPEEIGVAAVEVYDYFRLGRREGP